MARRLGPSKWVVQPYFFVHSGVLAFDYVAEFYDIARPGRLQGGFRLRQRIELSYSLNSGRSHPVVSGLTLWAKVVGELFRPKVCNYYKALLLQLRGDPASVGSCKIILMPCAPTTKFCDCAWGYTVDRPPWF